jgi:hypothetical protein
MKLTDRVSATCVQLTIIGAIFVVIATAGLLLTN